MAIFVLGGDGYIGWPLAMRMARLHPDEKVVILDNQIRRRLVKTMGGESVTPILDIPRRLKAFQDTFRLRNLRWVDIDLTLTDADDLFATYRPRLIFHFAQIASAPFSMRGPEEAVFTLQNNEVANMRVIWSMRRHCPDAHLIKSGSFGQYAKCGLDLTEGDFQPSHGGKTATEKVPFPRRSDDIYHVSKINDSNYLGMACRSFGLRVTDVMQSTVCGVHTNETRACVQLHTRFDHDEYFGTVFNRFVTQAIAGHPLTIYGTGLQRTGLISLEDTIEVLARVAAERPAAGEHRILNAITETNLCVEEIAESIVQVAAQKDIRATITRRYDPRRELDPEKKAYAIENHFVSGAIQATPVRKVIGETLQVIARHSERIQVRTLAPSLDWTCTPRTEMRHDQLAHH